MLSRVKGALNLVMCSFTFECIAIQIKAESCFLWCCLFFTIFIFFSFISILGALNSKRCIEPCYVFFFFFFTFQCMAIQIKAESCFTSLFSFFVSTISILGALSSKRWREICFMLSFPLHHVLNFYP